MKPRKVQKKNKKEAPSAPQREEPRTPFFSAQPETVGGSISTTEPQIQQTQDGNNPVVSENLADRLQQSRGQGQRLPEGVRGEMEKTLGKDFSDVQVHTSAEAVQMNRELGARAFTHGSDIFFNQGEYNADSKEGRRLLAHEMTHVVQQGAALSRSDENAVQREKEEKKTSGKAMRRLGLAQNAIKHTKEVFEYGAGNQAEALRATNFNSYYRMRVMRNDRYWNLTSSVEPIARSNPEALTAAKADIASGGNCGEHADVAFDYLRVHAVGETINLSDKTGLDHAFVILGNVPAETDDQLAVSDPWPTAPTATLWEDHFAHTADRSQLNLRNTMVADGQNLKAVILSGLTLTDEGKEMLKKTKTKEETEREIASGLGDWIWGQEATAEEGRDYNYINNLGKVNFVTNQAELTPDSEVIMKKIAVYLKQYPQLKLRIEGHTDSVGRAGYNQGLSEKRAYTCYRTLTDEGIDPQRLSHQGFGESRPIAGNDTAEGRSKNRRVDFILSTE